MGGRVSITPRPLFTPGKDLVPIVQEAGWAPGPVWTGAEFLSPPPGFDLRTVQPVASPYTDWATRPTANNISTYEIQLLTILVLFVLYWLKSCVIWLYHHPVHCSIYAEIGHCLAHCLRRPLLTLESHPIPWGLHFWAGSWLIEAYGS